MADNSKKFDVELVLANEHLTLKPDISRFEVANRPGEPMKLDARVPMGGKPSTAQWRTWVYTEDGWFLAESTFEEFMKVERLPTTDGNYNFDVWLFVDDGSSKKLLFDGYLTGIEEDASTNTIALEAKSFLAFLDILPSSPVNWSTKTYIGQSYHTPNGQVVPGDAMFQSFINRGISVTDVVKNYIKDFATKLRNIAPGSVSSDVLNYIINHLAENVIHSPALHRDTLSTEYNSIEIENMASEILRNFTPDMEAEGNLSVLQLLVQNLRNMDIEIVSTPKKIYLAPMKYLSPGGPIKIINEKDLINTQKLHTMDNSFEGAQVGGIALRKAVTNSAYHSRYKPGTDLLDTFTIWDDTHYQGNIVARELPSWLPVKHPRAYKLWGRTHLIKEHLNRRGMTGVQLPYLEGISPLSLIEIRTSYPQSLLASILVSKLGAFTDNLDNLGGHDHGADHIYDMGLVGLVHGITHTGIVRADKDYTQSFELFTNLELSHILSKGVYMRHIYDNNLGMRGHVLTNYYWTGSEYTTQDW